jgi:HAD superfamily hydrolase (TIGR01509 family)
MLKPAITVLSGGQPGTSYSMPTAILDIDGTLVDSNYQHVLAWDRAFAESGARVPLWRIHRHMGMGGDHLVGALLGENFDIAHGKAVRAAEKQFYAELMPKVRAVPGATEAISWLKEAGWDLVLASSARDEEVDFYIDLLKAADLADERTASGDVEQTKPAADLIESALEKVGADSGDSILVGDSVWDIEAARRAGVPTVGVLTGGFPEADLQEAGAIAVIDSIASFSRVITGRDRPARTAA